MPSTSGRRRGSPAEGSHRRIPVHIGSGTMNAAPCAHASSNEPKIAPVAKSRTPARCLASDVWDRADPDRGRTAKQQNQHCVRITRCGSVELSAELPVRGIAGKRSSEGFRDFALNQGVGMLPITILPQRILDFQFDSRIWESNCRNDASMSYAGTCRNDMLKIM